MKIRLSLLVVALVATAASAQVPTIEREALIALFDSTDGANWTNNRNWLGAVGTECTWWGVHCGGGYVSDLFLYENHLNGNIPPELGSLSHLSSLYLYENQLSGSIPPELGNLSELYLLYLFRNHLSGSIPPELGNLSHLYWMDLSENQLSGSIPPTLGNPPYLEILNLSENQLSGSIPPELANLSYMEVLLLSNNRLSGNIPPELGSMSSTLGLRYLRLDGNRLSGNIPPEMTNHIYLGSAGETDLSYNALWTDDAVLRAFLDSKDPDWHQTQTIRPEGLTVVSVADRTVWLEWTPIVYTGDRGGYEVFSEEVTRAAVSGGFTSSKSVGVFPVTALAPGQEYDFGVSTFTRPHPHNRNTVISEPSGPVTASTTDSGCATPAITLSGESPPYSIAVASRHDSLQWSTGETTPIIMVNPSGPTYYWVRATGPGSCDEAAVVFVVPEPMFADGFESGDLSLWSDSTPLSG